MGGRSRKMDAVFLVDIRAVIAIVIGTFFIAVFLTGPFDS